MAGPGRSAPADSTEPGRPGPGGDDASPGPLPHPRRRSHRRADRAGRDRPGRRPGSASALLHPPRRVVPGHGDRVRAGHRHQGQHDPQELGRELRPDQGRGRQPQGRHLVGRDRRPASPGGGGRADRRVQVAEDWRSCRSGPCARPSRRSTGPSASTPGALGFGYNTELLAKKGLPEPKCWADLLDPRFKDEVQVADPNSSGTAYTLLATMVQIMGEDKGVRLSEEAPQEREPVHEVGRGARPGHGPGRDADRHHVHARHRHVRRARPAR